MSELQTPRILPIHLSAFHPSNTGSYTYNIRIFGTITELQSHSGILTCGPYGDVPLVLKPDSRLQVGKLVEMMGKVVDADNAQGCAFRVLGFCEWADPDHCDYKIYEEVVNATHRFTDVFYDVM